MTSSNFELESIHVLLASKSKTVRNLLEVLPICCQVASCCQLQKRSKEVVMIWLGANEVPHLKAVSVGLYSMQDTDMFLGWKLTENVLVDGRFGFDV